MLVTREIRIFSLAYRATEAQAVSRYRRARARASAERSVDARLMRRSVSSPVSLFLSLPSPPLPPEVPGERGVRSTENERVASFPGELSYFSLIRQRVGDRVAFSFEDTGEGEKKTSRRAKFDERRRVSTGRMSRRPDKVNENI